MVVNVVLFVEGGPMRLPARILFAVLVLSLALLVGCVLVGCGSSSKTSQTTPPTNINPPPAGSDALLGTWIVKNESATQYSLTFYADGTYNMTYAGASSKGTYDLNGVQVSLKSGGGTAKKMTLVTSGDMQQDMLIEPGGLTWNRV